MMPPQPLGLAGLPPEVKAMVFAYLAQSDLLSVSRSCRSYFGPARRQLFYHPVISGHKKWEAFCRIVLDEDNLAPLVHTLSWRNIGVCSTTRGADDISPSIMPWTLPARYPVFAACTQMAFFYNIADGMHRPSLDCISFFVQRVCPAVTEVSVDGVDVIESCPRFPQTLHAFRAIILVDDESLPLNLVEVCRLAGKHLHRLALETKGGYFTRAELFALEQPASPLQHLRLACDGPFGLPEPLDGEDSDIERSWRLPHLVSLDIEATIVDLGLVYTAYWPCLEALSVTQKLRPDESRPEWTPVVLVYFAEAGHFPALKTVHLAWEVSPRPAQRLRRPDIGHILRGVTELEAWAESNDATLAIEIH